MRNTMLVVAFAFAVLTCFSQPSPYFSADSLKAIVSVLASDSLKGRGNFTPELEKAADFISNQFQAAGLKTFQDLPGYMSPFVVPDNTTGALTMLMVNNEQVKDDEYVFATAFYIPSTLMLKDFHVVYAEDKENKELIAFVNDNVDGSTKPLLILLPPGKQSEIKYLRKHLQQLHMPAHSFLIMSHEFDMADLKISLHPSIRKRMLFNLIGVLPGKSLAGELVIFSAHYDHVGTEGVGRNQKIFNGANDNASGTAAMLSIMKYFAAKNDNDRTLVFIAFAGEELGLKGSFSLSEAFAWNQAKAMFNFEMLGKPDGHGLKTITVTNFSSSGLGTTMRKYANGIRVLADDHTSAKLDQRSDHFPFMLKNIPAHTFMCYASNDKTYHTPNDDTSTLNFQNFSEILVGMLPAIEKVVSGIAISLR